jgi:hypothetical protein
MDMVVELWNKYHLITLGVFVFILALIGLIIRKKDQRIQSRVLLVIAFLNLALHFLKLLIPEYREAMPVSFRKVTFENICATTTIMMPFIMLSKNKVMKDYLFYIGLLGGLAALIYPTEAFDRELLELDVLRFYICHMMLFIVPFYMVVFGIHELSLKRVALFPLTFIVVECLILANEVILMEAGFVDFRGDNFLQYNYRNSNFIFGPTDEFKELSDKIIDPLVPTCFKTVGAGNYQGVEKYIPVAWLVVPCIIYFNIIGGLMCILFTKVIKPKKW